MRRRRDDERGRERVRARGKETIFISQLRTGKMTGRDPRSTNEHCREQKAGEGEKGQNEEYIYIYSCVCVCSI